MKYAIILFVASLLVSFYLISPAAKKWTSHLFAPAEREVLSTLNFTEQGKSYKIIKVLEPTGLVVELYRLQDSIDEILDRNQLVDRKDAFYKFDDGKHNLIMKDINGDGNKEIILPSLDKNMKARLNVFGFDVVNEKLVKLSQH